MPNLFELTANPPGLGTGDVASRVHIRRDLERRFHELLKNGKNFRFQAYQEGDLKVFHVQVPSETLPAKTFWWDVVIEVRVSNGTKKSLMENDVKVFSNNPAFIFTGYAHVSHKGGFLIDWLKDKLPKQSYEQDPSVRNPNSRMGFDKSLWFAIEWIISGFLYKEDFADWEELDERNIIRVIDSFQSIFRKYEAASKKHKAKLAATKRKKKKALEAIRKRAKSTAKPASSVRKVKAAKKVKRVRKVRANKRKKRR